MSVTDEARRSRRRKQTVVGAVGLAAVLGGGAFAVTEIVTAGTDRVTSEPAAPPAAPATRPTAASAIPAPSGEVKPGRSAAAAKRSPSPRPALTGQALIDSVRGSAAKARDKIKRAPAPQTANALAAGVSETQTGSVAKDGRMIRVVSARQDLTGLRELALVADSGTEVGDAHCTQRFRLVAGGKVTEKPTLLICWRTSAAKSVYTIAVVAKGRPSASASVAALAARWNAMG